MMPKVLVLNLLDDNDLLHVYFSFQGLSNGNVAQQYPCNLDPIQKLLSLYQEFPI